MKIRGSDSILVKVIPLINGSEDFQQLELNLWKSSFLILFARKREESQKEKNKNTNKKKKEAEDLSNKSHVFPHKENSVSFTLFKAFLPYFPHFL